MDDGYISAWDMSDKDLLAALKNPRWRLSHLYKILNKEREEITFVPNEPQALFIDNMWYRNIIPKARQRGFSTCMQLIMLDACLFGKNTTAAVIAQTQPIAEKIFKTKIAFAYDRLPSLIRRLYPLITRNTTTFEFTNGSTIYSAVSTRSGTINYLHVSELGQISKKDPRKADEIQTGSLPSVPTTGVIVIESTVESAEGLFPDMCRRAKNHQEIGLPLSPRQYRLHFASWWDAVEYEADPAAVNISSKDHAYFHRKEADIHFELTQRKRAWYVLTRDEEFNGDEEKMKQQYPTTLDEAFEVSTDGLWLSKQMASMRTQNRICDVPYNPGLPVNFFWDIGRSDDIAIWCHQTDGVWDNFIDFIEGSEMPYAYYVGEMQKRGFLTWGHQYLPHDAIQRQYGAEILKNSVDLLEDLNIRNIVVVPRVKNLVQGGIEDMRSAFPKYRIDQTNCKEGILHLDGYAKVWNDSMGRWTSVVKKNGHQHAADAIRQHGQMRHEILVQENVSRMQTKRKNRGRNPRRGAMTV